MTEVPFNPGTSNATVNFMWFIHPTTLHYRPLLIAILFIVTIFSFSLLVVTFLPFQADILDVSIRNAPSYTILVIPSNLGV